MREIRSYCTMLLLIVITLNIITSSTYVARTEQNFMIFMFVTNYGFSSVALVNNDNALIASLIKNRSYVALLGFEAVSKGIGSKAKVKDLYALLGNVVAIAKSSSSNPSYVAIAEEGGEVILFRVSMDRIDVARMKFHGVTSIDKLFVTEDGYLTLGFSGTLRVLRYGESGWCEVGLRVGNATISALNGYEIVDHVLGAVKGSKGVERVPYIAFAYVKEIEWNPRTMSLLAIKVMKGNTSVGSAIVIVRYDNTTLSAVTDSRGSAMIPIPYNVTNVTIEAYYVNETLGGATYYGNRVLKGPLEPGKTYYVEIQIERKPVAVPTVKRFVYLSVTKITSLRLCATNFERPLFSETIPTADPRSLRLHQMIVVGNKVTVFMSYLDRMPNGMAFRKLEIQTIDLSTKRIVYDAWYRLFGEVTYSAVSDDLNLVVIATSRNILYVFYNVDGYRYQLVESFALPAQPTSLVVVSGAGAKGDTYVIVLGLENGYAMFLGYAPKLSSVKPIGRKLFYSLELCKGVAYVDAVPKLSAFVATCGSSVFYAKGMGSMIEKLMSEDLAKYVARNLVVTVMNLTGFGVPVNLTIRGSPTLVISTTNGSVKIENIAFGKHSIVIKPISREYPVVEMNVSIELSTATIEMKVLDRVFNRSLIARYVSIACSNGTRIPAMIVGSDRISMRIGNGLSCSMNVTFLPSYVVFQEAVYSFPLYDMLRMNVSVSKTIEISLVLPRRATARTIALCIFDENGNSVSNASVEIRGVSTDIDTVMLYNETRRCYEVHDLPYDVYVLNVRNLPATLQPVPPIIITANRTSIVKAVVVPYKPMTLKVVFSEPPKVDLRVSLGKIQRIVKSGTKEVEFTGLRPGRYLLKITPLPTLQSFGSLKIAYYRNYTRVVILRNPTVVNVKLIPMYKPVKIQIVDSLTRKAPIDTLRLYIDGELVATIRPSKGKSIELEGYLPIGRTVNITIVSANKIYVVRRELVKTDQIKDVIRIELRRTMIPITVYTVSSLGEKLSGVTVTAVCDGRTITVTSVDGVAQLYVPAFVSCSLVSMISGYSPAKTQISVATSPITVTMVLRPHIVTLIFKYMTLIVAAAIVAAIAGILIYLRKKIIERVYVSTEELL